MWHLHELNSMIPDMNSSGGCLAVIPARGGSKGIPRKNIASVAGRPLIAWTIAAARGASTVDRVVVSTDDPAIAAVSRNCGAETPFQRPLELAQDDTPGTASVVHALRWLEEHENYRPELFMLLQPTSPLRTSSDIDAAVQLLRRRNADAVVSVTPAPHHPYWMKRIEEEDRLSDFLTGVRAPACRQDLPCGYGLNGAIYLARRDMFLSCESWYSERTCAYVMPEERSLDIDSAWHLYIADIFLRERGQNAAA